tara:strand:+ start:862 stop:1032 length:171 start_codon:yes stop_codon:yes gene_type:complete
MGEKFKIFIVNEMIEVTNDEMMNVMRTLLSYSQEHPAITIDERISYTRTVVAPYVI